MSSESNRFDNLELYCTASPGDLMEMLSDEITMVNGRPHGFKDNGSNVLAVVHLDTAIGEHWPFVMNGDRVVSPALDDRLGLWAIFDGLPALGVLPDVLLTTDEEIGRSTAADFVPQKDYNWIFSFDRRGSDVVMYEYHTSVLEETLYEYGFHVGMGSYSDISYLGHLGVSGFNFGTGYQNEHTVMCHAQLSVTLYMLELFAPFYLDFCDVKLAHSAESGQSTDSSALLDQLEQEYQDYYTSMADEVFECTECLEYQDWEHESTTIPGVCRECAMVALDLSF